MNVFNLRRLRLTFVLLCLAVVSQLSQGQHMLFHLLGAGQPIANFTSTSQTVAESTGVWAGWSSNLSAWTKRRQILVDGVSGALTDFPVMIKLDSTRIDYGQVQSAGQDLRFTNDAGTLLSYEIEKWDSAGTSIVWVKVPTLSAYPTKSSIWMYYGNAVASDAQSSATWDANHRGVWHLSGNGNDATSNANNGTVTGAVSAASQVGNGLSFSAAGDRVQLPDTMISNNSVATIEGWFKTSATDVPIFAWSSTAYPTVPGGSYVPTLYIGNDGKLRGEQWMGSASPITTSGTVNDGAWHHVALVINSTTQSLYLDGQLVGTLAGTVSLSASMKNYIGVAYSGGTWPATAGGWRTLNGSVDELRISTSARSADWIQASYLSARDGLATFRSEETPTSGAAVITVQLNTSAQSTITIPYTVSGTATAGTDHSRVSGNLVINGGSSSGSLSTYVLRDNLVEGSETAILTLGAPTGASLGPDTVHTVTITDEVLSPPDAVDDSINVTNFSAVMIPVLSNDTDANGDTLTITAVGSPTAGTAVRVGQTIRYTPTQDFPATDSFTYTISDGRGGSDTATVTVNYQIPFTWIGSGADANWNTAGNWLGGAVPGTSNTAYFNNQCTTYCNPLLTANLTIGGIQINSSYAGTFTQPAGITMTVQALGWTQYGGTFVGGNSAINVGVYASTGTFRLQGGSFTSTSDVLQARAGFEVGASGTFVHSSGTVDIWSHGKNLTTGTNPFYKFKFRSNDWAAFGLSGQTLTVLNDLTLSFPTSCGSYCSLSNGTVNVSGNVTVTGDGARGNALIRIVGSTNQTIDGSGVSSIGGVPGLQIASTGGTVSFVGTVNVYSNYTYTSGTVAAGASTLGFIGDHQTIVPGAVVYNHVAFGSTGWATKTLSAGTLDIAGNLTLNSYVGCATNCQINSGAINVAGNLTVTGDGFRGNATITLNGSNAATVSAIAASTIPTGTLTVNKDAKATTVTVSGAVNVSAAAQAMTITRGTVNLAGFALSVNGLLTIGTDARLLCNGGTVAAGSTSITGELSCGASLGITWLGTTGDGLWSTAGNWTNNTIPGASDIAYFNGSCTNCNATINGAVSVKGIMMASTYTGTLTQGAGNTITVGTSGWGVDGGTFVGSDAAIPVTGAFVQTGGTFTSTSATITAIRSAWTVSGGTFNHGGGTVKINNGSSNVHQSLTPGTANYNNVYIDGWGSTQTLTGTWNVTGTLTVGEDYGGALNGGTIVATGAAINFVNKGYGGSTVIRIAGSSNQTITGVATAQIPILEIASTGGTVTYSGTLWINGGYTYTSGTIDTTGTTVVFSRDYGSVIQIVPGATVFNNVSFTGYSSYTNITGTLTVGGTLTISDTYTSGGSISGGTIVALGDVTYGGYGKGGTTLVRMAGSGNQTLTGVATSSIGAFEIASTGGTVSIAGTPRFTKNFTYTSGTIDAGTSTVTFYGTGGGPTGTITSTAVPTFNNVSFVGYGGNWTVSGTLVVGGTLSLADTASGWTHALTGGTILAMGPVSATSYGMSGTTNLKIAGSGNQTVSGVTTASYPSLEIASTGGTVTFSGTLNETRSYVHTSGAVDASTSTLRIATSETTASQVLTPGATVFNHVELGGYATTWAVTGTMTVNGTLTFNGITTSPAATYNGGAISASGDVIYTASGITGTVSLSFDGSSSSTLNVGASAGKQTTAFVINKTGGAKVTLATNLTLSTAGQDLSISAGTLDLGGYVLSVADVLTVNSGTTLKCSGGTFTNGTLSNSGTINCPGYSGYEFNWTGAGGDSNWNTVANWAGGNVPGASDTPAFQDTYCGANCNVTMNVAVNIRGLQMLSPYTGTITQASGVTVTVGTTGWTQAAGTFTGSNAAIANAGVFALSGGTFTAPSSTVSVDGAYTVSGDGTFTAGTSTLQFTGAGTRTITPGTGTYNNITFPSLAVCGSYNLSGGSLKVGGALNLATSTWCSGWGLPIDNGTIQAFGDIVLSGGGATGTAAVVVAGNASGQTVTGASGATVPNFQIVAGVNNVTLSGTIDIVTAFTVTSVGTLTTTGSTLRFAGSAVNTITPGAHTYNNVVFPGMAACNSWTLSGGTLNVGGTLTVGGTSWCSGVGRPLDNGTIRAYGPVDLSSAYTGGTATILVAGNSSGQTVTGGATSQVAKLNFDTGSYAATLSGAVKATTSSNVATGSVALANSSSSFNTLALTLNGRTFTKNGGALTVNSVLAGTGSLFGGTVAP